MTQADLKNWVVWLRNLKVESRQTDSMPVCRRRINPDHDPGKFGYSIACLPNLSSKQTPL